MSNFQAIMNVGGTDMTLEDAKMHLARAMMELNYSQAKELVERFVWMKQMR